MRVHAGAQNAPHIRFEVMRDLSSRFQRAIIFEDYRDVEGFQKTNGDNN